MDGNIFCCYEFGEFTLDSRRRILLKNGEKAALPARNFDLLLYLVENDGRVIAHEELLEKVWAGTFVELTTLKKGISALRQILGENSDNEFIKTVPRRGYGFVAPVRVVPPENGAFFIRETEQEIVVEEYEQTDETALAAAKKEIETPAETAPKLAGTAKKINLPKTLAAAVAAIAVLVLAIYGWQNYFSKNNSAHFQLENVRVNRITNSGKIIGGAVVSPDGQYLLHPNAEKEGTSLWLRQMATGSTNRLTAPVAGNFWGFAFAPDNSYVYYIINNHSEPEKSGLYKMPLLGGETRRIKEDVGTLAIAPDGKRIALVRQSAGADIFTVDPNGDDEQKITTLPAELNLLGVSWSPDGKSLLCTLRRVVESKPQFYVSEIASETGAETVVLPPQEKLIYGAVWLPDKSAFLCSRREPHADIRQIWQYFPDSTTWRRVTNDNNSYRYVSLPRDGKNIVTIQESRLSAIWAARDLAIEKKSPAKKSLLSTSDDFRQITDGINNFDWLSWLADGRIIYSSTDDSRETVSVVNPDGTDPRRITGGDDGIWTAPNAAGDGRSIGFTSARAGVKQIWKIDADGKNLTKMTGGDSSVFNGRILRDNATVIYTAQQIKGARLFRQTADGQTMRLTDTETGSFAVSPDETLLAVETIEEATGRARVELRSLPDNKIIKIFEIAARRQLRFTPDGKNLAYDARFAETDQIMIQPLAGGEAFALTDFQSDAIFSFDWSFDGTRLALIRGRQLSDAVLIKSDNTQF